ncbi:MAG: phosphatase PAP2 family protein [Dehalococcoidia bacterium]
MDALLLKSVRWTLVAGIFAFIIYRNRATLDRVGFGREISLVVFAYFAYFAVRGVTQGAEAQALINADRVVAFERKLGILWEPAWQAAILPHPLLVDFFNWIYVWGHWPVIITVATWLFMSRPDLYRLYRNAFLFSGAIGLVIFATFPVAPPRLAGDIEVIDTVTLHSNSYRVLQPPGLVNQYAAVPSLHFGWNMLLGIAIVTAARSRWVKLVGAVIPPIMFLAIVLTANHYIIDAVAGAAVAGVGLWLAWSGARDGPSGQYADAY